MYVIDGHNLIPKIPGFSLRNIDDEQRLIDLLIQYAQARRKNIEVFFDGAPPGWAGQRRFGARVNAHFVSQGKTADEAIRQYLSAKGKAARGLVVVSSDRQVQANARALYALVTPSESFADELMQCRSMGAPGVNGNGAQPKGGARPASAAEIDAAELQEWLDIFGEAPDFPDSPPPRRGKGKRGKSSSKSH